jgi:hypothetical protein
MRLLCSSTCGGEGTDMNSYRRLLSRFARPAARASQREGVSRIERCSELLKEGCPIPGKATANLSNGGTHLYLLGPNAV